MLVGCQCLDRRRLGVHTQLLDAPMEAPLARMERGKISETRVHETGPHEAPKPATEM